MSEREWQIVMAKEGEREIWNAELSRKLSQHNEKAIIDSCRRCLDSNRHLGRSSIVNRREVARERKKKKERSNLPY